MFNYDFMMILTGYTTEKQVFYQLIQRYYVLTSQ